MHKKIKSVLTYLAAGGLTWNLLGCVNAQSDYFPNDFNVLTHAAYVVSGKGSEPKELSTFLKFLISFEVPLKLFCIKIQIQLKRLQKKSRLLNKKDGKEKEGSEDH